MNIIKESLLSIAVVSAVTIPIVSNAEGFGTVSANVALVTDYYFRGISQTGNDGAIQGGFDWEHESGVYAGVWASNVDFGDTHLEVDTYLGFANTFGNSGVDYNVEFLRYNYNDANYETNEVSVGLRYSYFSASYSYSDDWYNTDESANYFTLDFSYDLPLDHTLSLSVGKSFGDAYDKNKVDTDRDFDYIDYKIGVSKDLFGLTWDLSYVGNDLSNKECDAYVGGNSICDDRVILSVAKSIGDVTKSTSTSTLPISANVALVTDYYFRGISQTGNDGAIQGGFDWEHESGIYAGVWASNVDFGETHLEVDTYLGFANTFGESGVDYNVEFIRYNYNDANYETNEVSAGLRYSYFSASYSYSDDWYNTDESANYVKLSFDYALPYEVALSTTVGKSFGDAYDKDKVDTDRDFDYTDYKVGISKDLAGVNFDLSYVGSDLNDKECEIYAGGKSVCDDRVILSISKGF
ncbi:MAG: TorF family putative porin [Gammaproteobacteria bacterium]|nr:TorF family putative porin [Gammaproteobacteria bacterium]